MFNSNYLISVKKFNYKGYKVYLRYKYVGSGLYTQIVGEIVFNKEDYTWQNYLKLPIQIKAVKHLLSKVDETFERARRNRGI